jgi:ATP phosphoribosyltransferase
LQCSILKLYGSIELAPVLSLSDFIVDIVESGKTLKANGLKEFDKIFDISSLLIANKVSYKIKKEEINSFIDRVKTHDK